MVQKPDLVVCIPLEPAQLAALTASYTVHDVSGLPSTSPWPAPALGATAVVTNGSIGLGAAHVAALPQLRVVHCFGAGFERVDLEATRAAGVAVTHAPNVNDANVADHALALLLACARGLVTLDRAVRRGEWRTSRSPRPALNGRRVGLLGLGHIGFKIATRVAAFDAEVAYHTRTIRPSVPWPHYTSLTALARDSDFLVVACPGGAATRHLVDAEVLAGLGPAGFLINAARGSVVETPALVAALQKGELAGAGLDVVEGEPTPSAELLALDSVVFTPHVAGRSPDVVQAQLAVCLSTLAAHFAGRPLPAHRV